MLSTAPPLPKQNPNGNQQQSCQPRKFNFLFIMVHVLKGAPEFVYLYSFLDCCLC